MDGTTFDAWFRQVWGDVPPLAEAMRAARPERCTRRAANFVTPTASSEGAIARWLEDECERQFARSSATLHLVVCQDGAAEEEIPEGLFELLVTRWSVARIEPRPSRPEAPCKYFVAPPPLAVGQLRVLINLTAGALMSDAMLVDVAARRALALDARGADLFSFA